MSYQILTGDVIERLRDLPDNSVHCVVTSPPYWGLRDYGTGVWEDGDPECDHRSPTMREGPNENRRQLAGSDSTNSGQLLLAQRSACGKCGAVKVDQQIGNEATPAEFLAKMVAVFREVRRVLRADGTCWVNMGDAYANDGKWGGSTGGKHVTALHGSSGVGRQKNVTGLKPKDLIGMPWRLAFALQEDGWWLRQDIIWAKPNPMPESVTDRCTKAHEYIFLLTKSARYFYDAEAVKEESVGRTDMGVMNRIGRVNEGGEWASQRLEDKSTRNKRSVWEIATEAYPEAHFATFPTKLVEPCILAGTSERGCCSSCGAPWVRIVERGELSGEAVIQDGGRPAADVRGVSPTSLLRTNGRTFRKITTTGWKAGCGCDAETVPCTVLDIFNGSGTTGVVALNLGREYIGIELNPEYVVMAERRLAEASLQPRLFAPVEMISADPVQVSMFGDSQ